MLLCHMLYLSAANQFRTNAMTDAGLESLNWFADLQRSSEGHFVPIGSNGFYQQGWRTSPF